MHRPHDLVMRRAVRSFAPVLIWALSSTCVVPTDEPRDLRVVVDHVVIVQRLEPGNPVRENAAAFGSKFEGGDDGSSGSVICPAASLFCVWQLPSPANSAFTDSVLRSRAARMWTLRLGDQLVVSARLEHDGGVVAGSELTEVVLTKVAEEGRGPARNRVRRDTLDLLSLGEVTLAVRSAGFPSAVADTVTLVVTPGWMINPCATDQNPACDVRTLFIGDTLSIRGGPFATLRDPVTQEAIAQLLEPEVRVYGEPAVIANRSDSLLTVFVPAAAQDLGTPTGPVVTMGSLGISSPCIDPPAVPASCFAAGRYPYVPWDVLEPTARDPSVGDTVATDLGTFGGGDTLFARLLALEDEQEATKLGGSSTARDWYTFTLTSPTSLLLDVTSTTPLLLQLTNALTWDALQQRHRVAPGGWGIGSPLVCDGVELDIQFQQDARAGRRTFAVSVPAGNYHLLVRARLPLPAPVAYGLTMRNGPPPLPADGFEEDDQCGGATGLASVGQSNLTLDGPNDVDWFRFTASDSVWTTVLPRIKRTGQVLHGLVVRNRLPDSLPIAVDLGPLAPLPILPLDDYYLIVYSDGASGDYRLLSGVPQDVVVAPLGLDITTTDAPKLLVANARDPDGLAVRGATRWRSLNPYRATIDAVSGMVTAHASGQVTVAAEVGGVAGYGLVTVADPNAVAVQTWAQESDLGTGVQTIWGLSPTMIWASTGADIWMYDGTSWTQQLVDNQCCNAFWGSSATDVWAVAANAREPTRMLHWDGTSWTQEASFPPDTMGIARGWGSSPTDVWFTSDIRDPAGRGNGKLYHYDGATWRTDSLTRLLDGVWGSAVDNIWTAGKPGESTANPLQIFRFDGVAWKLQAELGTRTGSAQAVFGTSSRDVWTLIQGQSGFGFVYRNQGAGWSEVSVVSDMSGPVSGLWGSSARDMYAAGLGATPNGVRVLYHFDGSTWHEVDLSSAEADFAANDIWGTSDGPVWIAGTSTGGGLLRGDRP